MSHDLPYPDEPAGPFPTPPARHVDQRERAIDVEPFEETQREGLVAMYASFDPDDRAQGLPPTREDRIREWLETILDGLNIVARHQDRVVGHAMLVPDDDGSHELAIFVLQAYQSAGIGSLLIEHLLGAGADAGVERVWLSVERWNEPARRLYESVGFERTGSSSFELEMTLRLDETASIEE
jgi:ribosomal protein S18 acetylase RimI-like enzyme